MAGSWFGGFTDQLKSMAKDVLTEGAEEIDDHETALKIELKKTTELNQQIILFKGENESLRKRLTELNDSLQSSELQVNAISSEYKNLLKKKEDEVQLLQKKFDDLNESQKSLFESRSLQGASERSHYMHFNDSHVASNGHLLNNTFGDELVEAISHQQEINRLHQEVDRLKAELQHYKRSAKRQQNDESPTFQTAEEHRSTIKSLEAKLIEQSEKHHQELCALDLVHTQKLKDLKKAHQTQIDDLLEQVDSAQREAHGSISSQTSDGLSSVSCLQSSDHEKITLELALTKAELQKTNEALILQSDVSYNLKKRIHELELVLEENRDSSDKDKIKKVELELQTQIEDLRQELITCKQDALDCKIEINHLRSENDSLNQSLAELDRDHELVVKELVVQRDHLKEQNELLRDEQSRSSHEGSLNVSTEEIADMKSKLESSAFALNELHMTKADLESELKTTKAKLKLLAEKYKELNKQLKETLAAAGNPQTEQKADTLASESRLLQERHESERMISQLQDRIMELQRTSAKETSELKSCIQMLETELNQVKINEKDDISAMQQSLDISHQKIGELKSQVTELSMEKERLQQEIKHKDNAVELCQSKVESLEAALKDEEIRLNDITDKYHHSERLQLSTVTENLGLTQRLEEEIRNREKAFSALMDKEGLLESLKSDLSCKASDLVSLEQQLAQLMQEMDQLKVTHSDERNRMLESAAAEIRSLQDLLNAQNSSPSHRGLEKTTSDSMTQMPQLESDPDSSALLSDSVDDDISQGNPELSEIAELKTQVAELQELLAQKVLLINELQGGEDGLMEENVIGSQVEVQQALKEDISLEAFNRRDSTKNQIKSLEDELSVTRHQIDTASAETGIKSEEIERLTSENYDLRNQLTTCSLNLQRQEEELVNLKDAYKDLEDAIYEKDQEFSEQAASLDELKQRLQICENELILANEQRSLVLQFELQLGQLKNEKVVAEEKILKLEAELQNNYDGVNVDEDLKSLERELEAATQEINEKSQNMTRLLHDNEELRNQLSASVFKLREKETELADLINANTDFHQSFAEVNQKLLETQKDYSNIQNYIKELEEKLHQYEGKIVSSDEFSSKISMLESENFHLNQESEAATAKILELQSTLSTLQEQLPERNILTSEIKTLEDKLFAVQTRLMDTVKEGEGRILELADLKEENIELKNRINTISLTLHEKEEEFSKLNNIVIEDTKAIESLKETLSEKEKEIAAIRETGDASNKKIDELEQALIASQRELEKLSKDLEDSVREREIVTSEFAALSSSTMMDQAEASSQAEISTYDPQQCLTDELKQMQNELMEKDRLISDLKASNSSLKHTLSVYGDLQSLEAQVKSLRMEKEQMMSVMSEKSRENSQLKQEVKKLMDQITFDRGHNSHPEMREQDSERADMHKQALQKLSSLVRDREIQIEALTQKNQSLLAVLQQSGDNDASSTQISELLEERQKLATQITQYTHEREQLYNALQTKHQEAVTYHAECTRLAGLLQQMQSQATSKPVDLETEQLRADYTARKQQLIDVQEQLATYKQRCADLAAQLESSSSADTVPLTIYENLKKELNEAKLKLTRQSEALLEKDKTYEEIQMRFSSHEGEQSLRKSEITNLRKQIENLTFELSNTRNYLDDAKENIEKLSEKLREKDEFITSLRAAELSLQQTINQKEAELFQNKSNHNDDSKALDIEREQMKQKIATLTSECNASQKAAQQRNQAYQDAMKDLQNTQENERKLHKELERLRTHLVQIEESYTYEALEAEEREKELRNRLALAEEKAAHSNTAIQQTSMEASKQISSLEAQLHNMAAQRDDALIQLSNSQELCAQYRSELENLQLVLEQFQAEKDSLHAAELSKLNAALGAKASEISALKAEIADQKYKLNQQEEALEAAERLSLQLEKKDEAMLALKDEVVIHEKLLQEAEDKIRAFTLNNESKIDKILVKNLVLSYLTVPHGKEKEVLSVLARFLNFSESDQEKVGLRHGGGWIGGIWQKIAHPTPSSPTVPLDQSFSELFVKFLETESAPKPKPPSLPVDVMIEEEKRRTEKHQKAAAFNPFISPANVVSSTPYKMADGAQSHASHPLLIGVNHRTSPNLQSAGQTNALTSGLNLQPVGQFNSNTSALRTTSPSKYTNSSLGVQPIIPGQTHTGLLSNTGQSFQPIAINSMASQNKPLNPASTNSGVRFIPITSAISSS